MVALPHGCLTLSCTVLWWCIWFLFATSEGKSQKDQVVTASKPSKPRYGSSISRDQMLDQQINSCINRSKVRSVDQNIIIVWWLDKWVHILHHWGMTYISYSMDMNNNIWFTTSGYTELHPFNNPTEILSCNIIFTFKA